MSDSPEIPNVPPGYVLPKVWREGAGNGGAWAGTNRATAGATHERALPVGDAPLQLYSIATGNGIKASILLEELLEAGIDGARYDAWPIDIGGGEQFDSGFVELNPNSKIPVLLDTGTLPPTPVFESSSILLYLAEKFDAFVPTSPGARTECLNWLFWQAGSAPYLGGGFGHFYSYAPMHIRYCIDRYTMEVKRQLDVLERRLDGREWLAADACTIADIATWPWYGRLVLDIGYGAAEFIDAPAYPNVLRWARAMRARPAVVRGQAVNGTDGLPAGRARRLGGT